MTDPSNSPLGIKTQAPTLDIGQSVQWKNGIVDRLTDGVDSALYPQRTGLALDSLSTLGRRSALALLGIVIGSASIIAVINIGHNARHDVAQIFQDMGVGCCLYQSRRE